MRPIIVAVLVLVSWRPGFPQVTARPESGGEPRWQTVDQVCGQVELAAPTHKQVVVGGKTETQLWATHLTGADLLLYPGSRIETECCGNKEALERTQSNKYGSFYFSIFRRGYYWLRIKKGSLDVKIPLQVTRDFSDKVCHDHSVGRLFIADAKPPTVELRIY
jgi:hypothetical protein